MRTVIHKMTPYMRCCCCGFSFEMSEACGHKPPFGCGSHRFVVPVFSMICRLPRGKVVGGHYDLPADGHGLTIAADTEGEQPRVLPGVRGRCRSPITVDGPVVERSQLCVLSAAIPDVHSEAPRE